MGKTKYEVDNYLGGYKRLLIEYKSIQNAIIRLRNEITEPKGMSISDIGHIDGGSASKLDEVWAEVFDLEISLKRKQAECMQELLNIMSTINKLTDNNEKKALILLYTREDIRDINKVAKVMRYSYTQTYRFISSGMSNIANLI